MSNGDVEIELAGETKTLKCTLGAAKEINARFGSFMEAARQIDALNLTAHTFIVAKGLGVDAKKIEASVFITGVSSTAKPLGDYIASLSRGGQPADNTEGSPAGE